MKGWVKILITILVIVVMGFAIWAFFFREKDEVVAHSRTSAFINYKYSTNLASEIDNLRELNYIGDKPSNIIDGNNNIEKDILEIRTTTLNKNDIIVKDGDVEIYRYQSYQNLENLTDEIIYSYLPYLKGAKVKNSYKRAIEKDVKKCISNMGSLRVAIDEIESCQTSIKGTDVEMEFLLGKYQTFRNCYRNYLNSASNLILDMQDYINYSLYGNKVKMDTYNMLYDSFTRQLRSMTSVDIREEVDRATAINKVYYKISLTNKGVEEVFDSFAEYEVLQAYNFLINNYIDDLNFVFDKSFYDKTEMAKSNNLSKVKAEAHSSVVVVLNALGF